MTETMKDTEINCKEDLVDYFRQGSKPPDRWSIGTEHEKFLFRGTDLRRLDYDSDPGIKSILRHMEESGWAPVYEKDNMIGLMKDGASISLEPGGQFELSGKNFLTVHETFRETQKHFEELKCICQRFGVFSLAVGFDPLWTRGDVPWMPKQRYAVMRDYMPGKGTLGLDMMTRTATIQVNLDYGSERDMVRKMRVSQAFQPIVTALFANSPFSEGKDNGYLSYRAHVWDDTDPERCGFLPFIFDEGFGFERWVDYLLDVPMYFIYRDGTYIPAYGMNFRRFMNGGHSVKPVMKDWETHVSTVFPDVRLKRYIEMRGADASCVYHISALAALWVGLLYDSDSLDEAYSLACSWTVETIQQVRAQVPEKGLKAASGDMDAAIVARELLKIASAGLTRRSLSMGIEDEGKYLEPILEIAESGITQAERYLEDYYKGWDRDVRKLVRSWPKFRMFCCKE